jgi:hypothetical protein
MHTTAGDNQGTPPTVFAPRDNGYGQQGGMQGGMGGGYGGQQGGFGGQQGGYGGGGGKQPCFQYTPLTQHQSRGMGE